MLPLWQRPARKMSQDINGKGRGEGKGGDVCGLLYHPGVFYGRRGTTIESRNKHDKGKEEKDGDGNDGESSRFRSSPALPRPARVGDALSSNRHGATTVGFVPAEPRIARVEGRRSRGNLTVWAEILVKNLTLTVLV
jgi:hypothetical protein